MSTLLDFNNKLSKNMNIQSHEEIEAIKDVPYQSTLDSLVYAMIST